MAVRYTAIVDRLIKLHRLACLADDPGSVLERNKWLRRGVKVLTELQKRFDTMSVAERARCFSGQCCTEAQFKADRRVLADVPAKYNIRLVAKGPYNQKGAILSPKCEDSQRCN